MTHYVKVEEINSIEIFLRQIIAYLAQSKTFDCYKHRSEITYY